MKYHMPSNCGSYLGAFNGAIEFGRTNTGSEMRKKSSNTSMSRLTAVVIALGNDISDFSSGLDGDYIETLKHHRLAVPK